MSASNLVGMFERIGARVKVRELGSLSAQVRLDVRNDAEGEFFEITAPRGERLAEVLHVAPRDRHLLLMVREPGAKHKFLCGHDERHWFVAAVPETAGGVGTVECAKEALKPAEVKERQERARVPARQRQRRKNAAFRRQGEWFLLPVPDLHVDARRVLHNEPIRRGNGKPHWAERLYRVGGETVMYCRRYPNGLTVPEYRALVDREPAAAQRLGPWRTMRRGMAVYITGRLRHADHKTITLSGWHHVLMNTETQSTAMSHVAFLD